MTATIERINVAKRRLDSQTQTCCCFALLTCGVCWLCACGSLTMGRRKFSAEVAEAFAELRAANAGLHPRYVFAKGKGEPDTIQFRGPAASA